MRLIRKRWTALMLGMVSVGCSPTEPSGPIAIDVILGARQLGEVGEDLPLPLLVRVTDVRGDGSDDATVSFSLTAGSGILDGRFEDCSPSPGFGDPLSTVAAETDGDGYAWVPMTAAAFGRTTVEAVVDGTSIPPVVFQTDVSNPGSALEISYPYAQEDTARPLRAQSFDVFLMDSLGDGIPSVPVIWEVTSGAGELRVREGCRPTESTETVTSRTRPADDFGAGASGISFAPTTSGITTVTATPMGLSTAAVAFTVDVTVLEIWFDRSTTGEYVFWGPDFSPDVTVQVGATVEWLNYGISGARIVSTSEPPGGTAIDSGSLNGGDRFRFVPDAAGTWEYVEEMTSARGTVTAS